MSEELINKYLKKFKKIGLCADKIIYSKVLSSFLVEVRRETIKEVKRSNKLLIKELKEMSRRTMELDFIIVKDAINDYFKKLEKELEP